MRKPNIEMSAVFTIGHSTHTRKEFLEILRAHRVKRVVDEPAYDRVETPASPEQEQMLERLSPQHLRHTDLAREKIHTILAHAPGNGAAIGGLKVIAERGWFAARPSGTRNIYKIYAKSFRGQDHLRRIPHEAQLIVNDALVMATPEGKI